MPAAPDRRCRSTRRTSGEHQVLARLLPQGRGRTHDHRHQPGARAAARDRWPRVPGRRQPAVRRRRRPAEPEPQESVHARCGRRRRAGSRHHQFGGHRPLDRHPRPAGASVTRRRRPRDARLPAQDGGSSCGSTHDFVVVDLPIGPERSFAWRSWTRRTRSWSSPHSRSRPSRTFASSWRWRTSWNTTGRRSDWWSTDPTAPRGSASPMWRPRSVARSTGSIVSDGRLAVLAVNRGVPFVVSHPDGALSRDIIKLARTLAGDAIAAKDKPNKRGLFARR